MPMVTRASVSWVSIKPWAASPCSLTSSACNPARTAAHPPSTPAHSVQDAAAWSESRFVSHAARSNSTVTTSRAAGKSFRAACRRGQSYPSILVLGRGTWNVGRAASEPQVRDPGRIDRIVVEPLAAFPTGHPGEHHALQQRGRRVAGFAVLGEHDLGDPVGRVEPHEVEQRQRAHRVAASELHRLVDVRHASYAALHRPDGVEQAGDEQQIHDETGAVFRGARLLAKGPRAGDRATEGLLRGRDRAYDLDELHEGHRVEEV